MINRILQTGLLGIVFLLLCLFAGFSLPVFAILGVSAGLDGHFFMLAGYIVAFIVIFFLFEYLRDRLKIIWKRQ